MDSNIRNDDLANKNGSFADLNDLRNQESVI